MAITLFNLVYDVAVKLPGGLREGTATGGSTTTIIDTVNLANIDDDYFNQGTAFITHTTDALAPQGEYKVITDFVSSSKTLTVASIFSAAVAAGDMYAAMTSRFPLHLIIQKINEVLVSLPAYPVTDDSSLTTVNNQRDYTLPAAAVRDLRLVYVREDSTRLDINTTVYNWEVLPAEAAGSAILHLAYDLPASKPLVLVYGEYHPQLRDYGDLLEEVIHPDRIIYEAAANCVIWYQDKSRQDDYNQTLATLQTLAERARLMATPSLPSRPGKIAMPWPYYGRR